ncbi:SIR2 family protein [Rhizobium mayense]|uniref:SIR2 family protein n=1 Tax=Rhizobium mayense TaxID=1312184 RepID=A0ABT7JU61_9HYPH|nr:SIR2 family protein [Rhizobium mayense]MDL2399452.1 SIR2 family protein [Rhizobium mayense]
MFRWKAIFTLNYDLIVEDAYRANVNTHQELRAFYKDQSGIEKDLAALADPLPYFKLHGSIDQLSDREAPLILTTDTYIEFETNRKRLFRRLEDLAYEYPIIFAGSRLNDPHIKAIIAQVEKEASSRPMYYFVSPGINQFDEALLAKRRITPLKFTFDDFMVELDKSIDPTARKLHGVLKAETNSIERHFRRNVVAPPGLAAFLTNNVEHVRSGLPTTTVTAELFYKGESQSWAPIEQGFDIERLPYATLMLKLLGLQKSEESANVVALRGVAGSGKSVLLRRIAYDLAATHGKLVLFAPPGANLRAEPLLELYDLTGLHAILVVDHAADQLISINNLLDRLEAAGVPITVLLADTHASLGNGLEAFSERLKFKTELRNLEDHEINSLLKRLREHKSLGVLSGEPLEKQREAFEKVADKQLLVALYEATQGKLLEDILVEEYHRILLTEAQELYLFVCTLNRFRVPVRAALVHRVMGIGFRDFERRFLGPLEGLVFAEIDPGSRDYAYRARHPHIADIVFRRILDSQSKQLQQYRSILEHMNISYSSDNDAMRRMLSFRNLRELAPGLEERRDLLSLAEKVFGDETFVLQQQAITEMNSAGGNLNFARQKLERAEALRPRDNSIKHTRASLLAREAEQAKDTLERRSLRGEAKNILRQVAGGERSDPYVCSLSAHIAIDEIRDRLNNGAASPNDVARLAEDAQKALQKGLSSAPDFEALIRESYRLRQVLQLGDRGIGMLETTLKDQPHLEYVAATYARAIFRKHPDKALAAIRTALQQKQHSKFLNQVYFELLITLADDFRNELELPLKRSFTPEDQNLLMHLHAIRFHFMRGDRPELEKVLASASKMRVPGKEKNTPRLPVINPATPHGRWTGNVTKLGPTSGFIRVPGMISEIFFRPTGGTSDDLWDEISVGSPVYFELRFNTRGPVAVEISKEEPSAECLTPPSDEGDSEEILNGETPLPTETGEES